MKIGIYAGSFNPFHIGHLNIYSKALRMFDDVLVLKGKNVAKEGEKQYTAKDITFIEYDGLLTDKIQEIQKPGNAYFLIRGLRNEQDFKYEQEQSYWLKKLIPKLQIVYIECDEEYKYISSSAMRQLDFYKQDITKYIL